MTSEGSFSPASKPLHTWTKEEVQQWFASQNWSEYAQHFPVNGATLAGLTEAQFKEIGQNAGLTLTETFGIINALQACKEQGSTSGSTSGSAESSTSTSGLTSEDQAHHSLTQYLKAKHVLATLKGLDDASVARLHAALPKLSGKTSTRNPVDAVENFYKTQQGQCLKEYLELLPCTGPREATASCTYSEWKRAIQRHSFLETVLPPLYLYKPRSAVKVFSRTPIYHEYQDEWRCGVHALNTFLGGRKIDDLIVANVAQWLHKVERDFHPTHRQLYTFADVQNVERKVLTLCAMCVGVELAHFRPLPLDDANVTEQSQALFANILESKDRLLLLKHGHYLAYIRHENVWYKIDSSSAKQSKIKDMIQELSGRRMVLVESSKQTAKALQAYHESLPPFYKPKGQSRLSPVNIVTKEFWEPSRQCSQALHNLGSILDLSERKKLAKAQQKRVAQEKTKPETAPPLSHLSPFRSGKRPQPSAPRGSGKWGIDDMKALDINISPSEAVPLPLKAIFNFLFARLRTLPTTIGEFYDQWPESLRTHLDREREKGNYLLAPPSGQAYAIERCPAWLFLDRAWADHYVKAVTKTFGKVCRFCDDARARRRPTDENWRSHVYADLEEIFWLDAQLAGECNSQCEPHPNNRALRVDVSIGFPYQEAFKNYNSACSSGRVYLAFADIEEKRNAKDDSDEIKLLCVMRTRISAALPLTNNRVVIWRDQKLVFPIAVGILRSAQNYITYLMWCDEQGHKYYWMRGLTGSLEKPKQFLAYVGFMWRLYHYGKLVLRFLSQILSSSPRWDSNQNGIELANLSEESSSSSARSESGQENVSEAQTRGPSSERSAGEVLDRGSDNDVRQQQSNELVLRTHFRVKRLLSQSAFAQTYLCRRRRDRQLVVLKVLLTETSHEPYVYRLLGGQALTARLHSYFFDASTRHPVLELEYIRQPPKRFFAHTWPHLKGYLRGILMALWYIHQMGIVHRDVKPDNILVSFDNNGVVKVKLIDFGSACVLAQYNGWVGTKGYMAPECWQEYKESKRGATEHTPHPGNDIWAVGIILLEHLAGVNLHGYQKSALDLVQWMHEKDYLTIAKKLRRKAASVSELLADPRECIVQYPLLVNLCLRMTELDSPSARVSAVEAIDLLPLISKQLPELPRCTPTNRVFFIHHE
jgi:serine/threonine protein kinase